MWYVNIIQIYYSFLSKKGFILTMWYVNNKQHNGYLRICLRFILTMWYVNWQTDFDAMAKKTVFYINYVICKYFFMTKGHVDGYKVLY